MRRRNLITIIASLIILFKVEIGEGACPTSHQVVHDGDGKVFPVCDPSNSSTCFHYPKFWCLSGGTNNNNGTNTSWWKILFDTNIGYFEGDWAASDIVGCCGMWDAESFDSRTMIAVVEMIENEGTVVHNGLIDVEVAERSTSGETIFGFTRPGHIEPIPIPPLFVTAFYSTGAGGTSTLTIGGFRPGYSPASYWAKLENGSYGFNINLNPRCSPGGASACPPPIEGYRVVAMARGCLDGTCADPTPSQPTTSIASAWNLPVSNGDIQGRIPNFPISGIQITNPATENPSNAYIYIATVMLYGNDAAWTGRRAGVITSYHSVAYKWGVLGAEITNLTANYITLSNVKVEWKSVAEGNVAFYNVYRSFSANGTFTRVNARPIAATGVDGSSYSFVDRIISGMPRDAYYKIEIIRNNGSAEMQPDIAVAKAKPNPFPKSYK